MTLAITIVGAVALLSGVLILIGAVAMTKFQRVYEAAILRTLGASTRMIGTMLAVEYGGLGLLAGAIGAAGALGLSWGDLSSRAGHPVASRAWHRRDRCRRNDRYWSVSWALRQATMCCGVNR